MFAVWIWRKRFHKFDYGIRLKKWKREHVERNKEINRTHSSKYRKLGFVPLNKSFSDSVAHHIDRIHVIYIPETLHNSIRHNVWTGRNMEEINKRAWEFLAKV